MTTPHSAACFSRCGRYRYWLTRDWCLGLPRVCWIMLNPSTADATVDDPTIRRCMSFARAWGCGGIYVVNLFAWRATDPASLLSQTDPVGPDNDTTLRGARASSRIIAAWGALGGFRQRDRQVMELLAGQRVECLGTTKAGHPRHPLYVKGDVQPVEFRIGGVR